MFCESLRKMEEGVNYGSSLEHKTISIIYAMYRFRNEVTIHQIFSLAHDLSKRVT